MGHYATTNHPEEIDILRAGVKNCCCSSIPGALLQQYSIFQLFDVVSVIVGGA